MGIWEQCTPGGGTSPAGAGPNGYLRLRGGGLSLVWTQALYKEGFLCSRGVGGVGGCWAVGLGPRPGSSIPGTASQGLCKALCLLLLAAWHPVTFTGDLGTGSKWHLEEAQLMPLIRATWNTHWSRTCSSGSNQSPPRAPVYPTPTAAPAQPL